MEHLYEEFKGRLLSIRKKRKLIAVAQLFMWGLTGIFLITISIKGSGNLFQGHGPAVQQEFDPNDQGTAALLFCIIVLVSGLGFVFVKIFKKSKREEDLTIVALIKKLFPDFVFLRSHYLPRQEIMRSKIFASYNDHDPRSSYHMYGYMRGEKEGREYHFSDIGLREDTSTNQFKKVLFAIPYLNMFAVMYEFVGKNLFTSRTADTVYYSFRGLFCWTEFHKSLQGHTIVLPDRLEATLGEFAKTIQSLNFRRAQLVNLEDPRFENRFVVYSTDQVEARYILSSSFMEKLSDLRQKFGRPLMASFCGGKMYLAVQEPDGVFTFSTKSLHSAVAIEEIRHLVSLAEEVVKDMDTNRIMLPGK